MHVCAHACMNFIQPLLYDTLLYFVMKTSSYSTVFCDFVVASFESRASRHRASVSGLRERVWILNVLFPWQGTGLASPYFNSYVDLSVQHSSFRSPAHVQCCHSFCVLCFTRSCSQQAALLTNQSLAR